MVRSRLTKSFELDAPVEWAVSTRPVEYDAAAAFMEARAEAIAGGAAAERVWLVEHPPLFTAGTSAQAEDLIDPGAFPVFKTSRGGQYTYHGPGQRVAYVMLDLNQRGKDVRGFVGALERWIIETLKTFDVRGQTREDRVGVWIERATADGGRREDKIAALGIRVRRWVTFHGVSINVAPDLDHFGGIIPCGVDPQQFGVTSLKDLGRPATLADVDEALRRAFEAEFGPTIDSPAPE